MLRPQLSDRLARHRAIPVALALLAAATLGACGVSSGEAAGGDGGDSSRTSTTEAPSEGETGRELTTEEQEAADALVGLYQDFGFSEDQARCVAEGLIGTYGIDSVPDDPTAAATDLFNECDITASDLGGIEDSMGGDSVDDTLRSGLVAAFEAQGLTTAQAECVADGYVEEFGTDVSSMGDPSALEGVFASCDVEASDLLGG